MFSMSYKRLAKDSAIQPYQRKTRLISWIGEFRIGLTSLCSLLYTKVWMLLRSEKCWGTHKLMTVKANRLGKPVVMVTQMIESMFNSPCPCALKPQMLPTLFLMELTP
ncbi:hypothetical protein DVH24_028734 [Malus domestica]|uniref:Uncharacterized protein n=1 Tax=Malus domestica TaxID=3750 RepID=A0A498IYK9_MALDO|nr:hypothetical protein DVH24_028734 [Malus domestica]